MTVVDDHAMIASVLLLFLRSMRGSEAKIRFIEGKEEVTERGKAETTQRGGWRSCRGGRRRSVKGRTRSPREAGWRSSRRGRRTVKGRRSLIEGKAREV